MEDKLIRLNKILNKLLLFSYRYKKVDARMSGDNVVVTWNISKKNNWKFGFESIEFPLSDLDTRIIHYRAKLNYLFKNRNKVC